MSHGDQDPHQVKDLSLMTLTILLIYQKSTYLIQTFILNFTKVFNINFIDMLFSLLGFPLRLVSDFTHIPNNGTVLSNTVTSNEN